MFRNIYHEIRSTRWRPAERLGGITFDDKKQISRQLKLRPTRLPVKKLQYRLNFIVWNEAT